MVSRRRNGSKALLAFAAGAAALALVPLGRADAGVVWTAFPPDKVEVEATSGQGAAATYPLPTAKVEDRALFVTCKPASGSVFPLGRTSVVCVTADPKKAVEPASRSFRVVVRDTTAPTFSGVADIQREATSNATTTVSFDLPKAKDAVSGAVPVTCSPAPGAGFPLGATSVKCTAEDAAENAANVAFAVRVVDTTPPVLSDRADLRLEATGRATRVTYDQPTARDAIDGAVSVACSPASGAELQVGETTVTCTARDASGNSASSRFRVAVVDTTPPTLTLPGALTVRALAEVGRADAPLAALLSQATANDLVDGAVQVTNDAPSGFAFGTTTVGFTAADRAGNVARGSVPITIVQIPRAAQAPPDAGAGTRPKPAQAASPRPRVQAPRATTARAPRPTQTTTTRTRSPQPSDLPVPPSRIEKVKPPAANVQAADAGQRPRDQRRESSGATAKVRDAVKHIAAGASVVPRSAPGGPWGVLLAGFIVLAIVGAAAWATVRELRRTPPGADLAPPLEADVPAAPLEADDVASERPPPQAAPLPPGYCEIVLWHGYLRSRFYAVARDENGPERTVAASCLFRPQNGHAREGEATATTAYAELLGTLRADGWEVTASGDRPFQTTLARRVA